MGRRDKDKKSKKPADDATQSSTIPPASELPPPPLSAMKYILQNTLADYEWEMNYETLDAEITEITKELQAILAKYAG